MKYIEIKIEADAEELEAVGTYLTGKGISSFSVEDPAVIDEILDKQHPYDWDYVDEDLLKGKTHPSAITVYLEEDQEALAGDILLDGDELGWKLSRRIADDEEWKNSYKEHFQSLHLTERLLVVPSWEEHDGIPGVDYMELDPGMAFGTGDHATTSMCAQLMENADCYGKNILDVGTGSGILAIGAAMLGSREVLGIDIDPTAVEIASENVKKNGREGEIKIILGDLTKDIDYVADMVVANLMAEIVMTLTEYIKDHLNKGGIFISSGILTEKCDMVMEKIRAEGLRVVEVMNQGEWSAIAARYE